MNQFCVYVSASVCASKENNWKVVDQYINTDMSGL